MFKNLLIASLPLISLTSISSSLAVPQQQNNHTDTPHLETTDHEHKKLEIPANQPIPKVDLIVHKDTLKGWNLEVKATNFRFAPETINKDSKSNQGHAHIYVNGKKMTRLYASWYYLENLPPGKNEVTVSLNSNTHETLTHQGQAIADTEIIEVSGTSQHQHQNH